MQHKGRIILGAAAALLLGAVMLRENRGPAPSTRQGSVRSQAGPQQESVPPYYHDVRGIEIPRTLIPQRLGVAKTRESYRVAKAVPEALMQLPCYCWCDRIDHKSLLDCFVDEHAEFCDICQDSALWAEKRLGEQASIETIRREIIGRYSEEYGGR